MSEENINAAIVHQIAVPITRITSTPMALQALETFLSTSARLSKPVLCWMIGLLLWA